MVEYRNAVCMLRLNRFTDNNFEAAR